MQKKKALISVYDKAGVGEFAAFLVGQGWEILSTGGSAQFLRSLAIPVTDVASVTGFPDCLDGRVKTLHPAIHAGILAKRGDPAHNAALQERGIEPIDLVCVTMYPFFEKAQSGAAEAEALEFIDIGGSALLRAAAKNYAGVLTLCDPADYAPITQLLASGLVPHSVRRRLAAKAFDVCAAYDAAIARYLLDEPYPAFFPLSLTKAQALRYGENNHQSAALYFHTNAKGALSSMTQLGGKELSYNNVRDIDMAWKAACAFGLQADGTGAQGEADVRRLLGLEEKPLVCCVAVKHTTPCGIALGNSLLEAFERTYICDPVSIFGGIVACNVPVDAQSAQKLAGLFLEIVIAPDFDPEALAMLQNRPDLRIMRAPAAPRERLECISVDGGLLVQDSDRKLLETWKVVTQAQPEAADIEDMIFGVRAVTFVKSNAIVVVKKHAALGIGAGETNRLWAAELALNRATRAAAQAAQSGIDDGSPARVLVSDAFFPFPDVAELAAASGIKTIIQPGGSTKDALLIETCDKLGVAMVFTGARHFRH